MRNVCLFWIAAAAAVLQGAEPPEIIANTAARAGYTPVFETRELTPDWIGRMQTSTWRPGCPVPLSGLRILRLSYWSFDGRPAEGELIIARDLAPEVASLFRELFDHGFLIRGMRPVEEFGGSDDRSMEANNTSAFNCRDVTGKPGKFSNHSWGRAIDINPLTNPYLSGSTVLPEAGRQFLDRAKAAPGSILAGSFIVRRFQEKGWSWGGDWKNPDYQHFEKPAAR